MHYRVVDCHWLPALLPPLAEIDGSAASG